MVIPPHQPWFKLDLWSSELPRTILQAISSSATDREWELTRACIMAAAYERDMITGLDLTGAQLGSQQKLFGGIHHGSAIMDNKSIPWINQIKGKVDVVTDQMLQNLPTMAIRTANAAFEDLRLNEVRSAALNATMLDPDAQLALYLWTRDALIKRVGFIRCLFRNGRLQLQRLHPWQVFYDEHDATAGELSQIHFVHLVDRTEWLGWYDQLSATNDEGNSAPIPEHKERSRQIQDMPAAVEFLPTVGGFQSHWCGVAQWLANDRNRSRIITDQIRVVWSYKRAWRAGEPTGRVTCTIMNNDPQTSVVALDARFRRSTLPVVHWAPWRADTGISGIGLAEQLIGPQMVADQMLFKITRTQQLYGHTKFGIPKASMTDPAMKALLQAGIYVFEFDGEGPPVKFDGIQISASDITLLNLVLDRPAAEQGITPGLTQGQSQLGPGASGIARVEEVFRSLDRQQGPRNAHGRAYRKLGVEALNCQDDALIIDKGLKARWPGKMAGQFRERPYAELTLSNGQFFIDVEETGILGTTRAGKLQKAQELFAQEMISPNTYREILYTSPDLARAGVLEIAPRRAIEAHLDVLLDPTATDEQVAQVQPTEAMDLADAAEMVTRTINRAIAQDASDETRIRLDGYLAAIGATRQALAQREAQAAGALAAAAAPPEAPGGAPPAPPDATLV